ncbi:MAG: insulinase family protein [Desulfobacterales bacterium]|jgi:zinc protease
MPLHVNRKALRFISLLIAAVWLVGCVPMDARTGNGSISGREAALPVFPHEKSDLAPDPALTFGRLENGFRYILRENHEPKNRVSMHLDVQAGSLHETDEQRGLAHFLEHMLFNGSEHFPPGELVKYFQRIGMSFGPDANAHTGFDETVYDILLPEGSKEAVAEGLLVMRDYAAGALLLEKEIEEERGVILAEKQARDSASYRMFESTFRFEMNGTLAARRLPIGTEAVIRAADRKRLKDFYDTWYRPENMILVMVGDFDAKSAEAMIRKQFAKIEARAPERAAPVMGALDHRGVSPFYHFEQEAGDTTVSIEAISSVPKQDDSAALEKEELVSEVANRIVQNRLDRMLQKTETPFTSASISAGRFLKSFAYAEISAKGPPQNWENRLAVLEQTLRQALEYGFNPDELDRVRKEMLAELETAVRKAPTRDSQDLARDIIRNVNDDRVFQDPSQRMDLLAPFLSKLTPEQVHEGLKKIWRPDHRLVLVTGNARIAKDPDAAKEKIRAAFAESRATAVSAPEKTRAAVFPFFPIPEEAGAIQSQQRVKDLGIVQVDLSNGLRLNVKRTDFKADEVSIRLAFGSGSSAEPERLPGLGDVGQGVVNESGMGPLTRDALDQAIAGRNTQIEFQVKEDQFCFSGTTVPDELELAFQLLYGYLTAPAFRQEALDLTVRRLTQRYAKLSQSIEGGMRIEGDRFLAGGDSRFGMADPASLQRISLEDVRNWLAPSILGAPLELSVVGDVPPERVIRLAARYLGTLQPRAHVDRTERRTPSFPAGKSRTIEMPTAIDKGLVVLSWPTEDFWDIHRTRRLAVLGSVFSEKLRVRIREKLGVAYSPYAYNDPSRAYPGYGRFMAVVPTDPGAVNTVLAEMRDIAGALAETPLTEDEMKRVTEPILTGLKDLRRTNGYWIDSVLNGSLRHPEQLQWARSIVADYGSIGASDIQKMARSYLENDRAASVVVVPAGS